MTHDIVITMRPISSCVVLIIGNLLHFNISTFKMSADLTKSASRRETSF